MNYSLRVNCNWILCENKFEMRNEIDNQKQKSETEMLCIPQKKFMKINTKPSHSDSH